MSQLNWNELLNYKRVKELNNLNSKEIKKPDEDDRSQFQRDYDRCLFSTPIRRLQDKAQVFPLEPHDSVRTRLTHSLEVSNIARGLAKRVANWLAAKNEISHDDKESVILIASTCALIHDLGNPPFGHAGEDAMRNWFIELISKEKLELTEIQTGDFKYFEGNAQTLRLVSKLQMLGDFSGLNLTVATLAASRKYLPASDKINDSKQAFKKLGYFQSEEQIVKLIEKNTGVYGVRHPITYIVEAADDIVYSVIDMEDGLKKGVLSWILIKKTLEPCCKDLIDKAEKNISDRATAGEFTLLKGSQEEFEELNGQALSEARMNILRTLLIESHMDAVFDEFKKNYESIMNGTYSGELIDSPSCKEIIKQSKSLARNHIFRYPDILKLETMGKNIIHDLMDLFWLGVKMYPYDVEKSKKYPFNNKAYLLLSENYKTVFEASFKKAADEKDKNYVRLQFLGDYICGMTDSFAKELHKTIRNG